MFNVTKLDHVGLRVSDKGAAATFYAKLGFHPALGEDEPTAKALGLINADGTRIHLIYNGVNLTDGRNVLMDIPEKLPGYTHAAFIVDSIDELAKWLAEQNIPITEGPVVMGHGRRKVCFIRDPDRNVLEFNEILTIDTRTL